MLQQSLKGQIRAESDRQVWFALEDSSGIYRGTIARVERDTVVFADLYYTGDDGASWGNVEFTARNADWATTSLNTRVKYFDDMGSARVYRAQLTPKAANFW